MIPYSAHKWNVKNALNRKSLPCRAAPRTGCSKGWRAKAGKGKDRLRKRKERMRRSVSVPMGIRTRPPPHVPVRRLRKLSGFGPFHAVFAPAAVPAQRGGHSGATASPFRRNGTPVPAQRGDLSIFYAINKLRGATKAPLTFRHSFRPRAPSKGRDRSPLRSAPPLPPGRGGSPLPPVAPPTQG